MLSPILSPIPCFTDKFRQSNLLNTVKYQQDAELHAFFSLSPIDFGERRQHILLNYRIILVLFDQIIISGIPKKFFRLQPERAEK